MRIRLATAVSIAALLGAGWLFAGPLNPPVGPVASTGKTLTEVEPRIAINAVNTPPGAGSLFKISQPGSYYLTGNVAGASGKDGIEIAASNVIVDLNGFQLAGVAGSVAGIKGDGGFLFNVRVTNGSVRNWGNDGIDLGAINGARVSHIYAILNGGAGIRVGGNSAVADCVTETNTSSGIITNSNSTVTGCIADGNTAGGISAGAVNVVRGCTAAVNSGTGVAAGSSSIVEDCATRSNTVNGFTVTTGCRITNCSADSNAADGIAGNGCTVMSNHCTGNGITGTDVGIHITGADSRIEGNVCNQFNRGVAVDGAGNLIIRNTCSGNGVDWVFIGNNIYGPIIDRRIPTTVASTPAVSGFAAASVLGSTDANANYSY